MKIGFTTMHANHLLSIYDVATGRLKHVRNELPVTHRPFGITWSKDQFFIAQPTAVVTLSKNLRHQEVLLPDLWEGLHQVLLSDNHLFVVSPKTNSLHRCDLRRKTIDYFLLDEMRFVSERPRGDNDQHHFNSIFIQGDRAFVSAHNLEQPSYVLEFDYPSFKLRHKHERMGRKIHNLYVEGDEIFVLDSLGSRAVVSNKGCHIPIDERNIFLRGLCVTEELFLVGYFPEATRHKRSFGDATIALIDRKTHQITRKITIRDVGSIRDMRLIDVPDLAHGLPPIF